MLEGKVFGERMSVGNIEERSCIEIGEALMMSVGKIHRCHVIEGAPVVNFH